MFMFPKLKLFRHNNFLLLGSAIAQALLLSRANNYCIIATVLIACYVALLLPKRQVHLFSFREYFFLFFLQVLACFSFWGIFQPTRKVEMVSRLFGIEKDTFILSVSFFLAICGLYFLVQLVLFFQTAVVDGVKVGNSDKKVASNNQWLQNRFLLCFVCSFISVTICSESSFLYPITTSVDQHCFMTVGKSMMHGLVPYRDLFEQKGPVLYYVYGVAGELFHGTFLGIYILEIVTGTVFLYYVDKIVCLYDKSQNWLSIPIFASLVYPILAFGKGGLTEEQCWPLIAYTFYKGIMRVKEQAVFDWKSSCLIGSSMGIVLWVKFTFLGFFIGWTFYFIVFLFKSDKKEELKGMLFSAFLGFIVVTIPVLLYFNLHHAVKDLLDVYFYDNIFIYSKFNKQSFFTGLFHNYFRGIQLFAQGSFPVLILIIIGYIHERKKILGCVFLALFCTTFAGGWSWRYYSLIFAPLAGIGMGVVMDRLKGYRMPSWKKVMAFFSIYCFVFAPSSVRIGTKKMDLPQYQFAKLIQMKPNPTLLNYDFLDSGFYMAADVLPNCKAFCRLNAPIPEMYALQEEYLQNGKCDFVVTKKVLNVPLYSLVSERGGYYLYQLKK